MTQALYRLPDHEEAVAWLKTNDKPWASGYRVECLRYWRELVGEKFMRQVAEQTGMDIPPEPHRVQEGFDK